MILGHNASKLPTAKRGGAWTTAMGQAIRVSPQRFRDRFTRAQAQWTELPDHHTPGEFEYSSDAPVAIWNDGFLAAAEKLTRSSNGWPARGPVELSPCTFWISGGMTGSKCCVCLGEICGRDRGPEATRQTEVASNARKKGRPGGRP